MVAGCLFYQTSFILKSQERYFFYLEKLISLLSISRYEGLLQDSLPHGQGSYRWPNGDHYLGGYQHGLRNGYGEMIYLAKDERYKGLWMDGLYHGQGQYW